MKKLSSGIRLSASDLSNHLSCGHLTNLDLSACNGHISAPEWQDPSLVVLQQRGIEHEKAYVQHLKNQNLSVLDLSEIVEATSACKATIEAMKQGADVIVQAGLGDEKWFGKADILRKVKTPSNFGDWSYDVFDTKLAKETRAGTILQLSLYSECVATIQGSTPELMHVIPPTKEFVPESFRVSDFAAYYRLVKGRLVKGVTGSTGGNTFESYPDPVEHCEVCRWWKVCDQKRRQDDHLSIVAGISKLQMKELQTQSIGKMADLAKHPIPFKEQFSRGTVEGYTRVREQARIQVAGQIQGKPLHETLELENGRGLFLLPTPSLGDIFFDIEGDPFVGAAGLEYLFGLVLIDNGSPKYICKWAFSADEELTMFEWLMEMLLEHCKQFPDFHIYHYAPYEPAALKRLMGRYGRYESEVDELLRAGKFIDLYAVVKQSIRASVESYSIKELERFYGFKREMPLIEASKNRHGLEHALELGTAADIPEEMKSIVQKYNEDDCVSAFFLRTWLEEIRAQVCSQGGVISRPDVKQGEASEELSEHERLIENLRKKLILNLPKVSEERSPEQQATWILAEMLSWHRREAKAPWWEFFRLKGLSDEELLEERSGLSGLKFLESVGGTARCPIHRYSFPTQETNMRSGHEVHLRDGTKFGQVEAVELSAGTVDIKKRTGLANMHPISFFEHNVVNSKVLSDALFRIGGWVSKNGLDAAGSFRAARDLLMRKPPRLRDTKFDVNGNESIVEKAKHISLKLDSCVLPIQGPPGAGKTFTAANMICELLRNGKTVGVTAVSHKVITNLLTAVRLQLNKDKISARVIQKVSGESDNPSPGIEEMTDNAEVIATLNSGAVVVGGTGWLWAREDTFESVDVLFVDEAGQMSLANVVAVAQATESLVLLGDPQQLEQPLQGSHPEGTQVSALEHLVQSLKTIPSDRGLFLPKTWRLHPSICAFTSELFYEG